MSAHRKVETYPKALIKCFDEMLAKYFMTLLKMEIAVGMYSIVRK